MDALIRGLGEPAGDLVDGEEMLYLLPPPAEAMDRADQTEHSLTSLVRVAPKQPGRRDGDIDSESRRGQGQMESDRRGRGRRKLEDEDGHADGRVGGGRGRGRDMLTSFKFPPSPPKIPSKSPSASPTASPLRKLIRGPASAAWEWWNKQSKPKGENNTLPELGVQEVPERTRRADLPEETKPRLPKGGLRKRAMNLVKRKSVDRWKALEKGFYANSSRASKNSKWTTVQHILGGRPGGWNKVLEIEDLKDLGEALLNAGYKSGTGYVIEAKMRHLENGGTWEPKHERCFKLCVKALERTKGPKKKALEVTVMERGKPRGSALKWKTGVKFAQELFIFATIWMMREIEIANMTTEDILLDHLSKRVTITWRMSKQDHSNQGVRRTLQCTCHKKCMSECPFAVAYDLVKKLEGANGTGSDLVVTRDGKEPTKALLVASWRMIYQKKVGGHSARRSGALHYIRCGWQVQQVAFLGRWASNVIMEYAKEALEDTPANLKLFEKTHKMVRKNTNGENEMGQDYLTLHKKLAEDVDVLKNKMEGAGKEVQDLASQFEKLQMAEGGLLPNLVQSRASKTIHINIALVATSPPMSWRTKCGWHFASSQYVFVNKAEPQFPQCAKCKVAQEQ